MHKKIWSVVGVFALVGMISSSAMANTTSKLINPDGYYTLGASDLELNFGFDVSIFRGDFKDEQFAFNLGGNYFLTDVFAPGVEIEFWNLGAGTDARFLPNLKAYWPLNSRLAPYAQVLFGYANLGNANLFNFGLAVGANYLLTSNIAIGTKLRYDLGAGDGTFHRIQFPIEFALYFSL